MSARPSRFATSARRSASATSSGRAAGRGRSRPSPPSSGRAARPSPRAAQRRPRRRRSQAKRSPARPRPATRAPTPGRPRAGAATRTRACPDRLMEGHVSAGHVRAAPVAVDRGHADLLRDYLALTKPRIIGLLLVTTVTTMIVAAPHDLSIATVLWTILGGYLAAGGAGAINHFIERDRDARMERTCDRPIASGRIEPARGLAFGVALGVASVAVLALAVNVLAAALALAGLLGYVFVYTLWLKPRTPQNIVLGGAAGAIPPLVGWAAATGGLTWDALYPFAIIFLWTPPHFWALALLVSEDYARVGVPMLPVVRGEP